MPPNMAPTTRSPTGSWLAAAVSRSQVVSPMPDEPHINGTRVASPVLNGRASRQDKKRLSLAFLTKEFLMGESEKGQDTKTDHHRSTDGDTSGAISTRSHSKDASRHRPSLSFMGPSPTSPQPEALPSYQPNHANHISQSQSSLQRTPSYKRPETIKSMKSDKSLSSRTGSVKKRLSFMNISKKSSKSSVRGRVDDTLMEE